MARMRRFQSIREKGQSMAELAVSLVLLLIILAGVVDLGRILFVYIAMRDAAEEAAVYGSINPDDCSGITTHVADILDSQNMLSAPGDLVVTTMIDGVACAAASEDSDKCTGKPIAITIQRNNFPITMPFIGAFLGKQSIDLETHIENTIISNKCQCSTCP